MGAIKKGPVIGPFLFLHRDDDAAIAEFLNEILDVFAKCIYPSVVLFQYLLNPPPTEIKRNKTSIKYFLQGNADMTYHLIDMIDHVAPVINAKSNHITMKNNAHPKIYPHLFKP